MPELEASVVTQLDPGIKDVVLLVHAAGFITTESGDGKTKPVDERTFDEPHVICELRDSDDIKAECRRLSDLLGDKWRIEASYSLGEPAFLLAFQCVEGESE